MPRRLQRKNILIRCRWRHLAVEFKLNVLRTRKWPSAAFTYWFVFSKHYRGEFQAKSMEQQDCIRLFHIYYRCLFSIIITQHGWESYREFWNGYLLAQRPRASAVNTDRLNAKQVQTCFFRATFRRRKPAWAIIENFQACQSANYTPHDNAQQKATGTVIGVDLNRSQSRTTYFRIILWDID